MSKQSATKPRVFIYENNEYADPDSNLSNEQVRNLLARTFPALTNGNINVKEEGERILITFSNRPQHKGCNEQGDNQVDLKEKVVEAAVRWYEARTAFAGAVGLFPPEGNDVVTASYELRLAVELMLAFPVSEKI